MLLFFDAVVVVAVAVDVVIVVAVFFNGGSGDLNEKEWPLPYCLQHQ